jgi:hypothetical protein
LSTKTDTTKYINHKFILKNPSFGITNEITIARRNYTFENFVNLIWKIIDELGSTISNTKKHSYMVSWDSNRNMKTELSFSTSFQFSNYITPFNMKNETKVSKIKTYEISLHNVNSQVKRINRPILCPSLTRRVISFSIRRVSI